MTVWAYKNCRINYRDPRFRERRDPRFRRTSSLSVFLPAEANHQGDVTETPRRLAEHPRFYKDSALHLSGHIPSAAPAKGLFLIASSGVARPGRSLSGHKTQAAFQLTSSTRHDWTHSWEGKDHVYAVPSNLEGKSTVRSL